MSKKFYEKFDKSFANLFNEKAKEAEKIVLSGHLSPDDDSVATVLATYHHLTQHLGLNNVEMVYTGGRNERWVYFENYDKIEFVEDMADNLEEVDLLILLDASSWYRFTRKEDMEFNGYTICIDHHPNPRDEFDLHMLLINYVSCAEIIYRLFYEDKKVPKGIAETIFMGIWGDTGGFRFVRKDNLSAFDAMKRLMREGDINVQTLLSEYDKISFDTLKLVNCLMENTKIEEIGGWPSFQYSYISRDSLGSIRKDSQNMESYHRIYLDQYMRMVKGAGWGFVITPKDDGTCGLSLRSLPKTPNVRAIAEQFDGGGHDRAAGGTIYEEDPEEALQRVLDWMKDNEPVIN